MKLARWLCYLFLTLASGCAALGVPTPTTFNERLASAYITVNGAMDTARVLLSASKITPADADNVVKQCDNAIAALDLARTMSKTDLPAANIKLTATITVLTALQSYLATKKG